jgi:hypothetical protein
LRLTGNDVTGRGPERKSRKYVLRMHNCLPRFCSYHSTGSTKCSTVVQVPDPPEVTEGHVTPPKGSLGCVHAQPEVAQYPP